MKNLVKDSRNEDELHLVSPEERHVRERVAATQPEPASRSIEDVHEMFYIGLEEAAYAGTFPSEPWVN